MQVTPMLPHIFAVFRRTTYRDPYIQLIMTELFEGAHRRNVRDTYTIRDLPTDDHIPTRVLERAAIHRTIYTVYCKYPETDHVSSVKFWYLPYYLRHMERDIPFLDFDFRSFLPGSRMPIDMERIPRDILQNTDIIREERLAHLEGPQRFVYSEMGPDDQDDRRYLDRGPFVGAGAGSRTRRHSNSRDISRPSIIRQPEVRVVEVEVPVDRIVIKTKHLALPKSVGYVLLANARSGSEACPISMTPYAECKKLCVSSCFHIFEEECLTKWQETNRKCPVCRSKIENIVSEEI